MADFDLFKVKVIDRYFSILENGLTLTKRRRINQNFEVEYFEKSTR